MPSKSKSQARFMAAAAHDPEFAKKAGISTKAAKEWNQADKKAGTLKKGSNKPEYISEEMINEAGGVGIFQVPPELLKQVQRIVGSITLTLAVREQQKLMKDGYEDEAKNLNTFLKRFQRTYNAVLLSDAALDKYSNSISTIKLDVDYIYNNLPENIKKTGDIKSILSNITFKLVLSTQSANLGSSSENGNVIVQEIKVPTYRDFENRNFEDIKRIMNNAEGTVEHEMQHSIKSMVISKIKKHDSQTELDNGYFDNSDDESTSYYASGTEFGSQVKDVINIATNWLHDNVDELSDNKKENIVKAIKVALSSRKSELLLNALKKLNKNNRAKKVLKLLYRGVENYYDNKLPDVLSTPDELSQEQHDEFDDLHDTSRSLKYPVAGETALGDLWLAYNEYFGETPKATGDWDNLQSVEFTRPYGNVKFELMKDDNVKMNVSFDGDSSKSFNLMLNPETAKNLYKDISYFSTVGTVVKLKSKIEDSVIPSVDLEKTYSVLERENNIEKSFSTDDSKSIKIEYVPDESAIYLMFNGARKSMIIYERSKNYIIEYGNSNTSCNQKEFEYSFIEIFKFYYDEGTTPRMVNKFLRNLMSSPITVEEVQSLSSYIQLLGDEQVSESSMRNLIDVVQNAEIEKDISDAEKQTDINRTANREKRQELNEMPWENDVYNGDRDFVDDTLEHPAFDPKSKKLILVNKFAEFNIFKNPRGNAYMAITSDGNVLGTVQGINMGPFFKIDIANAHTGTKGVMYRLYTSILADGKKVLSDTIQSPDAIKFWKRLISSPNHIVYVVYNGEILEKAVPEKFHKYWSKDPNHPSKDLQFLLAK